MHVTTLRRMIHGGKSRYIYLPNLDKVICQVQRAGSTSMRKAVRRGNAEAVTQAEVAALKVGGTEVVMWFRNPLHRLISIWRLQGSPNATGFIDATLDNEPNVHWNTQLSMHTFKGDFLPTRVHKFDDIAATWAIEFPRHPLKHLNKGRGPKRTWAQIINRQGFTPEQVAQVEAFYAEDIVYYDSL